MHTPRNGVGNIVKRYESMSDCCCEPLIQHVNNECCQQKQKCCSGNLYHPAPSTTKLEININQRTPSPAPSYYSVSPVLSHRHPAPHSSLPPPPCFSSHPNPTAPSSTKYAEPSYSTALTSPSKPILTAFAPPKSPTSNPPSSINSPKAHAFANNNKTTANPKLTFKHNPTTGSSNNSKVRKCLDVITSRKNSVMFRVCVVQLLLSVLVLAGGIWCAHKIPEYCPYYSGIWTSSLFIINSLLGIVAAKLALVNLYVAHLVLSLASIVVCVLGALIALKNWESVGTYHHPKLSRDHAFCLLGEHDASRISYIFSHMDNYNFKKCLLELKIGIAVNSVQLAAVAILFFLYLFSVVLCMKRTCTRCK